MFRTRAEIGAFFTDFDLIHPGLADVTQWFPYGAVISAQPAGVRFLAGVGRKL